MLQAAARANDAVVTNADAGQDNNIAAEPDVVADGNRRGVLPGLVTQGGVQRVIDGVEGDVGGKEDVVADGDGAAVQDGVAAVGVEVAAKADALAVVAVKGRGDVDAVG